MGPKLQGKGKKTSQNQQTNKPSPSSLQEPKLPNKVFFYGSDTCLIQPLNQGSVKHDKADKNYTFDGTMDGKKKKVTLQRCSEETAMNLEYVEGKNLLQCLGWARCNDYYYIVSDSYDMSLREFASDPRFRFEKTNKGIIHALKQLHDKQLYHGSLNVDNVVVKFTTDGFLVKLKNYHHVPPDDITTELMNDLVHYGEILQHCLPDWKDSNAVFNPEARDLICRIDPTNWPLLPVGMPDEATRNVLSARLHSRYEQSPGFLFGHPSAWDENVCREFYKFLDDIIGAYGILDIKSGHPLFGFLTALEGILFAKAWDDGLHDGLKKHVKCPLEDRRKAIPYLHVFRNVDSHYPEHDKDTGDTQKDTGRENCYEYLRNRQPELLIQLYRCVELNYTELDDQLRGSSQIALRRFFGSSPLILQ